ncbi:MAG: hypothetical protein ACHQ9S_26285 [Candidatus Binatia bacterium]
MAALPLAIALIMCRTPVKAAVILDAAAVSEKEVSLTVPASNLVDLALVRAEEPGEEVNLALSPFHDELGNSVTVELVVPSQPELSKSARQPKVKFPNEEELLPIQLSVPKPPTAGKYSGNLIFIRKGKAPVVWKITLTRGTHQPATLVVDPSTVPPLTVTLPMFPGYSQRDEASVPVTLRDKTRQWGIEGLFVSLEQVTKAPPAGFDLERNATFELNGKAVKSFAVPPVAPNDDRSIPEGGQALVRVGLHALEAGEYNLTLGFHALNSADDGQRLVLTLQVRDSYWWAALALAGALVFSFASTKGLGFRRQRLTLLKKISDLGAGWLRNEPFILPVVSARAVLRQSEDLTRALWLASPDEIETRLTRVSGTLGVLDQARQLREAINQAEFHGDQRQWDPLVATRARAALDGIVAGLSGGDLGAQVVQQVKEKLTNLSGWLDSNKLEALYWADVKGDVTSLLKEVVPGAIANDAARTEIQKLVGLLATTQTQDPLDFAGKISVERAYARLKILWERRSAAEFVELIELQRSGQPLEVLFEKADDAAWTRLRTAQQEGGLRILVPQTNGPDPIEAYDPIRFKLSTGDPDLNETYLVKHGLQYEWAMALQGKKKKAATLTPMSAEPNIVQYSPWSGTLTPSVTVQRGAEVVHAAGKPLPIAPSKDFRLREGFEAMEVLSFVIAAFVAIISGMITYYFKAGSFGSPQDYLSLILWGVGADQTKNALQILQTYSAWPTKQP